MKRFTAFLCVIAILALLTACSGISFSLTASNDHMTLDVKDAEDETFMESDYISVGKNRIAKVVSSLEKGQIQVDFVEAAVFLHDDGTADVYPGDVYVTVTLGPDEDSAFELPKGEYVVRFTSVGESSGKLTIDIEKKE